ncbi:Conserved hypothetical protein [Candidatus Protochlamydia naegleriophila]|uniref:Uncharacterized protein n=1 Tax=Candidatus Protochlamydia naegleriophila TaxID=389348 RepID=A0A0U5K1Y6_9BACT|nr:hypothetical protein [Candidatus Protochlamydia naegleriophila]CUI16107.1 Conserved hypothetical protein [Candidatus Protochlamydia naegleriophila]
MINFNLNEVISVITHTADSINNRNTSHSYIKIDGKKWSVAQAKATSIKEVSRCVKSILAENRAISLPTLHTLRNCFDAIASSYLTKHSGILARLMRFFSRSVRSEYQQTKTLIEDAKNSLEQLILTGSEISPSNGTSLREAVKSTHVFIFSGPFEGEHTGDTDYAEKMVDLLEEEQINASYITGSTVAQGAPLYDPKDITYAGYGERRKIVDDDKRKQAVANVISHLLSFDGPKIFHLQLRVPETGCLFLPEDLKQLKEQGIKVIVTCHEWQLNNHRPWYQEQAFEYFQEADKVVFLNQEDASHAVNFSERNLNELLDKHSVSAVPITVTIHTPPSVAEVLNRDKNIITFGLIRPNKGFEQAVYLAQKIKDNGPEGCKVLIAGKPTSFNYFMRLATPILALNEEDTTRLKQAWDQDPIHFGAFKQMIHLLQKENRPEALPAEFHIDLSEQEWQDLVSRSKYAYKPDNKGFANNASAIINLLANGCITFAKWGIVTDRQFLPGGTHGNAIILTKEQKPDLANFSPEPEEVIADIRMRESDPDQKLNRETVTAALKAAHDPIKGVFSNKVVTQDVIAVYEQFLNEDA